MAARDGTRLMPASSSAAQGRRFGLTVGGAFLVIAALMLWRGHAMRATIALALGALLVLGALAVPARLVPVERAWMRGAERISRVTTPLVLGIVYFVVLTPLGLLRRLGGTPIRAKGRAESTWEPHAGDGAAPERMERQF